MSEAITASQGAGAADRESRYGHLLEPIRDLASNWHIDLAGELEEYLSELDQIRIRFEPSQLTPTQSAFAGGVGTQADGSKTLNFAQAALLIQGSACIYSRKVEYLYGLLYHTLDALIDKRKSKQASSIDRAGDDIDAMLLNAQESEGGVLLSLDDEMKEGSNIDLPDSAAAAQDEENTELDEHTSFAREQAAYEKRQESLLIRAPLSLLNDQSLDSGAGDASNPNSQQALASQFKISSCLVHSSGALLLEEKEALLLKSNDQFEIDPSKTHALSAAQNPLQAAALSMPFGSPRGMLLQAQIDAAQSQAIPAPQFDDAADLDFGGGAGVGFDDDEDHGELERKYGEEEKQPQPITGKKSVRFAEGDDEEESDAKDTHPFSKKSSYRSGDDNAAEEEEDFWQQLDPHDDSTIHPRPYRAGNSIRKPVAPSSDDAALAFIQANMTQGIQMHNTAQAMLLRGIAKQSVNAPFFAEFSTLFLREQERRKKRKRSVPKLKASTTSVLRASTAASSSGDATVADDDEAFGAGIGASGGFDDDDDLPAGGGLDFDGLAAVALEEVDGAAAATANAWDHSAAGTVKDFTSTLQPSLDNLDKSYEDLCKEHVAAYLKSAEQYLTSSVLSRRVLEWQERLLPILEAEEEHTPYDIHAYGRELLDTIQLEKTESHLPEDAPVDFSETVKGKEPYEICRMFLATLQLANSGNVDLSPSSLPSQATGGVTSLSVRVLSMADKNLEGLKEVTVGQQATLSAVTEEEDVHAMIEASAASSSSMAAATTAKQPKTKSNKRKNEAKENEQPVVNIESLSIEKTSTTDSTTTSKGANKKVVPLGSVSASESNRRGTRRTATMAL